MTTRPRPASPRLPAAVAGLAAALVLAVAPWATPAGAHDGEAIVVIEAAHPAGTQVHYIVRVTWENDGHPADDATVTASAEAADGTLLTPVPLDPVDSDGRYAGVVDYPAPGSWTVRVTSVEPTGSTARDQEITAAPTTQPAEGGSEVTTGSGGSDTTAGGFTPADDGTGASDSEQAAVSGSGDGGMPLYLVVAAAAVVVIGAVTAVNIIRRNSPHRGGGATPGDPDPDDPVGGDAAGGRSDDPGEPEGAAGDGPPDDRSPAGA